MEGENQTSILDAATATLIVDDSIQFATILSKLLRATSGYTDITQATTIEKAISLLSDEASPIRLIVVDYRFPNGETGLRLLQWMSEQGKTKKITTFLITSEPTPEILSKVLAFGGFGVIAKPVDRSELKKQLEKAQALRNADELEYF